MPHRLCPVCRNNGRLLEQTSRDSRVDYYRCDACAVAWTHDKDNPASAPNIIAERKPAKT